MVAKQVANSSCCASKWESKGSHLYVLAVRFESNIVAYGLKCSLKGAFKRKLNLFSIPVNGNVSGLDVSKGMLLNWMMNNVPELNG